ncbi:MAG: aldehyde dehydrogenase family protein [Verrucomicrobia bacterium]|nr:MAG: aldehyde dehydrogenase family protein [Verrucomicrobiota bacterium]
MQTYQQLIDGEWTGAAGGKTFQTFNPADTREAVAEYPKADAQDARAALEAAARAFPGWAAQTPVARGRILSRASQILESRKDELARLLTREEGKTLAESAGEVQRAIDIFRFFGGLSYVHGGQTIPHDLAHVFLYTTREPLGVAALITPWNFPIAIPAWKLAPALLAGNTVVLKPASPAPAMAFEIAKALQEAGLPPGVLNVITGPGGPIGAELTAHPAVRALSFTGSHQVGQQLYQQLAPRMVRAQMEMGGKNPTIVLEDADLDLAATLCARAGFGLTGQACTATSRAIVVRPALEPFLEKLVERARAVRVGNGLQEGVTMGPAINESQLQTDLDYVRIAQEEGARLVYGGHRLIDDELEHGWFVEPTIFADVTPSMRIAQEEVFGPVIAVIAVDSFDEAIEVANGIQFGLSASIVTRDLKRAMLYAERIQAGVVKINQVSTGLALQAPFGGVKGSSTDSFREQGAAAVDFYSRIKTVYLDYSA